MMNRVILVWGLKHDSQKERGYRDSDNIPVTDGPFHTAFGPLPQGVYAQDILRGQGWTHLHDGIYAKTIDGVEHRAMLAQIPDLLPLSVLPF
jgi:hypothetical protein